MKRIFTILSAAVFASAIAVPAFAQGSASSPEASPAAASSPSAEKPAKKHHHHGHKKKSDSGATAPEGGPSDSTSK